MKTTATLKGLLNIQQTTIEAIEDLQRINTALILLEESYEARKSALNKRYFQKWDGLLIRENIKIES
jgi:hypothetical protein